MNDELANQIPAQDCELEYWLQQAENYAEVQIPADDLRAIIARTYAAVNALPELLAKVKRLEEALKPFAEFERVIRNSYAEWPDDRDFYRYNDTPILLGDLRRARAALKETGQ